MKIIIWNNSVSLIRPHNFVGYFIGTLLFWNCLSFCKFYSQVERICVFYPSHSLFVTLLLVPFSGNRFNVDTDGRTCAFSITPNHILPSVYFFPIIFFCHFRNITHLNFLTICEYGWFSDKEIGSRHNIIRFNLFGTKQWLIVERMLEMSISNSSLGNSSSSFGHGKAPTQRINDYVTFVLSNCFTT